MNKVPKALARRARYLPAYVSVFLMLGFISSPAFAQWPDHENWHARNGQNTWSFEGFYFGGSAAYGWGNSTIKHADNTIIDMSPSGGMGGVYFGVNRHLDEQLVLGLEGDVHFGSYDDAENANRTEFASLWTVRGILGYEFTPDRMIYGSLGLTGAGIEFDHTIPTGLTVTNTNTEATGWLWGLHLGIGYEQFVRHDTRVRLEYVYNTFADWNFSHQGFVSNMETDIHSVRIGISLALDPAGH